MSSSNGRVYGCAVVSDKNVAELTANATGSVCDAEWCTTPSYNSSATHMTLNVAIRLATAVLQHT